MPTYQDYNVGDMVKVVIDPPDEANDPHEARKGERGEVVHIHPATANVTILIDGMLKWAMDYRLAKISE